MAHDASSAPRGAGGGALNAVAQMQITIVDRGRPTLRDRIQERLDRAAALRCEDHDRPVVAVHIHARENGWFDVQWVTCCDSLESRARAIVRDRC